MSAYFPIKIRGKDYIVIQKGNLIELEYKEDSDKDVPERESEIIIMYLMDEGFIK